MTIQLSVAEIKNRRRPRNCEGLAPTQGTKVRELFDLFMAHKAEELHLDMELPHSSLSRILDVLRDRWGLDIRRVKGTRRTYILVGEYLSGVAYVDYMAEKHDAENA